MERKLWTPGGEVPLGETESGAPPRAEPAAERSMPGPETGLPPELSEEQVEEIRQALQQLRQIPVEELILNEVNTLAQVAQLHLHPDELDQARLAIDAIKALVGAAGEHFGDLQSQLTELISQLQLAYVQAASAARGAGGEPESTSKGSGDKPEA